MAPNRRKKKPSANPARGFATVSVPSRAKNTEFEDEQLDLTVETQHTVVPDTANTTNPLNNNVALDLPQSTSVVAPSEISGMSAEQFEAHLIDSELHALVEQHAAKCKSSATHQRSKLLKDRRQLRSQADKMSLDGWPEDTVTNVLKMWPQLELGRNEEPSVLRKTKKMPAEEVLLNMWILKRILSSLDLTNSELALAHILKLEHHGRVSIDTGLTWGLSEALDWYALNQQNMPGYDDTSTVIADTGSSLNGGIRAPATDAVQIGQSGSSGTSTDAVDDDLPKASKEGRKEQREGVEWEEDDASMRMSPTETDSSSEDDDNDPTRLKQHYLKLQERLWRLSESKSTTNRGRDARHGKRLGSLQSKISSLENDILFDKAEAETEWYRRRIQLQAEAAQSRRNVQTRGANGVDHDQTLVRPLKRIEPEVEFVNGSTDSDDEESDMLSGMFGTTENGEPTGVLAQPDVKIVDFGNSAGLAPRVLLSQVCHALDEISSIQTSTIQKTSYSARHRADVLWKTPRLPDDTAVLSLPREVTFSVESSRWVVRMSSIAASTASQSIEYVSLISLFLVLSSDGQDKKVGMRLTGIWKELLFGLFDSFREHVMDNDKATLKTLRSLIDSVACDAVAADGPLGPATSFPRAKEIQEVGGEAVAERLRVRVNELWKMHSSSSAFHKMSKARQQLPIAQYKDNILSTISENATSIISAETGSGKSTQVGSYILEHALSSGRDCRIMVTEPRRIAAISLARRVSQELGEPANELGSDQSLVGYSIRMESKTSPSTRLTFATTGVLLRMLETAPSLQHLDYIILDEVHERTIEMDLLMVALRRLQLKRSTLRVVLMSATVNAGQFSRYFDNAPVLDIPGRTFPVEQYYLEDAIDATNDIGASSGAAAATYDDSEHEGTEDERSATLTKLDLSGYSSTTRRRLADMDEYRIDFDLIVRLATAIATKPKFAKYSKAILIFMPGIAEIRRLYNAISSTDTFGKDWDLHMLHSSFSTEDLEKAFMIPHGRRRKIVIATNIAETGITIPDVTAVIDTAKEKIMRFNERRQLSKLSEGFISRSSAKQRRGRAARVQDGLCFHLVTQYRHDNLMLEQQVPEMLRLSLQESIMRIKIWRFGSVEYTFNQAIEPPPRKTIIRAMDKLKDAGALTNAEELTPLGEQLARLPLDVRLAKLAVLGSIFRCLDPVLTIIALMSSKSPFLQSEAATQSKLAFKRAGSDLLTSCNAFNGWKKAKMAGSGAEFCRRHHLMDQVLSQAEDQKVQLMVYLVDGGQVVLNPQEKNDLNRARSTGIGRRPFYDVPEKYNADVGDDLLLCVIAMAYHPRIVVREGKGWRNTYTNQHVSLTKSSVNYGSSRSINWLSFVETMQNKMGKLNVLDTSRVPEAALALLLGEVDIDVFAGVVSIDNGKMRLSVNHWRQALAIKTMRRGLKQILDYRYRHRRAATTDSEFFWIGMLMSITA